MTRSILLLLVCACGQSHSGPDALHDGGVDAVEPCPDFSCEPRCSGISVCMPDGGSPDATPPHDGGDADTEADGGRADAGEATSGVPCGGVSCESPIAVCVICPHEDFTDAHCLPAGPDDEGWPFRTAMESHPFCGFPGLFIQCDGPEDCGEDQDCVFSGGEWGYAECVSRVDGPFQAACRSDADCDAGVSCGEVDPLGYFSPHFDRLGWRPYACGGASARASAYCDTWSLECDAESGFFDRAQCLRTVEVWSDDEYACAQAHLGRGACSAAAGESPCAP